MAEYSSEELFTFVKDFHTNEPFNDITEDIDESKISLKLRPYQISAVKWMLYREKYCETKEKSAFKGEEILLPKGGILADEMGLGKTIEVLCCILNNPYNEEMTHLRIHKKDNDISFVSDVSSTNISSDDIKPKKRRKRKLCDDDGDDSTGNKELNKIEDEDSSSKTESDNKNSIEATIESVVEMYKSPRNKSFVQKYPALFAWYENALSEVKTPSVLNKSEEKKLQCFCNKFDSDQICCLTCNTWQHRDCVGLEGLEVEEYHCPQCWSQREPVKSKATFIITPASISSQWEAEIEKHINAPGFSVLVYNGVKGNTYIQPEVLASYDVVITNYNVLCSDLNYTENHKNERQLRHTKRYFSSASPLTSVKWWRVCLDEAQMVESYQSKTAVMAKKLSSVYYWAVTGTPIQKSIHDLFGLFQFLKVHPYQEHRSWIELTENKEEFFTILSKVLWRNSKNDVLEMLGVPPQSIVHHWLRFSPVETYFYQRTHNECAYHMRLKLCRFDDLNVSLKDFTRDSVNRILLPLLRLRQACIHPQAVRGKFLQYKHTMTMTELLSDMVAKAKNDVEIALRQHVSSINGIAAIHIINFDWEESIKMYRQVLHLGQEKKTVVKVDTLQMIHTLHNLAEVLEKHSAGIPPTLRDATLEDDAKALAQSYIKKYENAVESAKQMTAKLGASIAQQSRGATLGFSKWWDDLLDWVDDPKELLSRITIHLDDHKIPGQISLSSKLRSIPAVQRELAIWLANADTARIETLEVLRKLETFPMTELAAKALNCHLSQNQNKKRKRRNCPLCHCESVLHRYETCIFSINKHSLEESDDEEDLIVSENDNKSLNELKNVKIMKQKKEGSWKPTQMERVLQVLGSYARAKKLRTEWIEDASKHLALLEIVRKEFKWLRAFWSYICELVQAGDEIEMAKLRLRVPSPEEEAELSKKKDTDRHLIMSHEVSHQFAKLQCEYITSESAFKKNSGILLYLQNLQKEDKAERDPCPVCREALTEKWSVLQCGHCFCFVCIRTLLEMGCSVHLECAVCRIKTPKDDVSYVSAKSEESENYNIKGSYSTKILAVVAELLKLKEKEPSVKVLIFSTWEKVLDVIEEALQLNSITYRRYGSGARNKTALAHFKAGNITALLLPLRFGSKGLNLVEATHVFLVEPILNPADELQAVGRVHRIGQNRETYVHRFVIHNTIEERILTSLESVGNKEWSSDKLTLQTLFDFFSATADSEETGENNESTSVITIV